MAPKDWLEIAGWAALALPVEVFLGFGFAFSPGWANGWPAGLTIYSVWSAGMSVLFFSILLSVMVVMGAVICAVCARFVDDPRRVRVVFSTWLVGSIGLALAASRWAFWAIHASAREMWPNGYNP